MLRLDGNFEALEMLLKDLPLRVFAHNVECVPRLDRRVRDSRASFQQSLQILSEVARIRPDLKIKSSLMVGLGETDDEVVEAMKLLRSSGVHLLTIGQYLQPSDRHLQIDRFPEPASFEMWTRGKGDGFEGVACGPLVRSSYRRATGRRKAGAEPVVTRDATGSAISSLQKSAYPEKRCSFMTEDKTIHIPDAPFRPGDSASFVKWDYAPGDLNPTLKPVLLNKRCPCGRFDSCSRR